MSDVIFSWPITSWHGWGIRGLGYALNWPGTAVSAFVELDAELPSSDSRTALLIDRIRQSRDVQAQILAPSETIVQLPDAAVFVALGNDLTRGPCAHGKWLRGRPTISCPVFENVETVEKNIGRLSGYDAVVVASRWNQEVLSGFGVDSILCHEGIDPVIFNPSVRRKRDDGRFRVFSGGKAEWRKGQDLVIEAFKLFAEKHDDAVLVASWGSPWSQSAADFEGKWDYGAPPGIHIGQPNYVAWAQRAGIKPHQFELVPQLPNWRMAEVYGGCDVAVFPNRREGGTNFVAMECVACGVPTYLRKAYGQSDLFDWGCGVTQGSGCDANVVDGIAMFLADAYDGLVGECGLTKHWTWERHCRGMAEIAANA